MAHAPAEARTPSPVAASDAANPSQAKPDRQRTLAKAASFEGVGFFHAADVSVRLTPAEPNSGLVFVRTDLAGKPKIPAVFANRIQRHRRTALASGDASVEMTEHVLAALAGMGVDNCLIELNGPEMPGLDGSSLPIVEAIVAAGIESQSIPRIPFVVEESVVARDGDTLLAAHSGPTDHLEITFNLDYGDAPGIGRQSRHFAMSPDSFAKEIAPARTFIRDVEIDALRGQGIGKRTSTRDLLVFGADGGPIENSLRFPDECVRHKILDCIGDLALLGRPLYGHVLAHRAGHQANAVLVAELLKAEEDRVIARQLTSRPLLDSIQIEQIMPHRYPFLLLDRVVEMDPNRRAVGIKNVSYNEPFFQGHWPGRPVMPGVLIVEAMAQLAGVMLTQWQTPGRHAFIVAMDGIRLRRQVIPGDQLRLEAVAQKLKSRMAVLDTKAWVGRELAAEAQLKLVVVDEDSSSPAT